MKRLYLLALPILIGLSATSAMAQFDSLTDSVRAERRDRTSRVLPELRTTPVGSFFIDIIPSDEQLTQIFAIIKEFESPEGQGLTLAQYHQLTDAQKIARHRSREEAYRIAVRRLLTPKQQILFDRNVEWARKDYNERLKRLVPKQPRKVQR